MQLSEFAYKKPTLCNKYNFILIAAIENVLMQWVILSFLPLCLEFIVEPIENTQATFEFSIMNALVVLLI